MKTPLRIRRNFFDSYGERLNERNADLPPGGIRFSCPCCGYPTLRERSSFEICELCWWEDDGQDDFNADKVSGGPNHHYSLSDARLNFENYLVMYPPELDTRIGGADSEKVRDLKRNLIKLFESIMKEPSGEELNYLWQNVDSIEKALHQDVRDSIREYEAKIPGEKGKT